MIDKIDREWRKSKCIAGFLHRFDIHILTPYSVKEVCNICKKEIYFSIVQGQTDNFEYLDYHLRQALPKWHPYYKLEYPNAKTN